MTAPAPEMEQATTGQDVCDVLRVDDTPACDRPATVQLVVQFPCGADELRHVCARHARWIDKGWLFHAEHPDADERGTLATTSPIGGAL